MSGADTAAAIVKQVDFYFSDSNLARDKFLQETIKKDDAGWVPLTVMLKFKRLAQLSNDETVIAEALVSSDLIEVSEDKKSIRRSPAHPLADEKVFDERSIYAKGFPTDKDEFEPIEKFYTEKGFKVLSVRLRRQLANKAFKGSAFIELDSAESAAKAVAEPLEYQGTPLVQLLKKEYLRIKKEKYDADKKAKGGDDKPKAKQAKKEAQDEPAAEEAVKYEPGCLLSVKSIPAGASREDLKTTFAAFGEVAWVEFDRDDVEGVIRFKSPDAAKAAEAGKEGKVEVSGGKPELKVLEGDEEKAHYAQIEQEKRDRFSRNSRGGRGGRGRGGRGGRGGPQKRKNDGGDRSGKRRRDD